MLSARELPLLPVFAAVARHGSFTRAAQELGASKSLVSGQVRELEELLGARLLHRTTRRVQLTEVGAEVLRSAESVERELLDLGARLESERRAPRGKLRVATTYDLGHLLVAPAAAAVSARFSALQVELVVDDSPHDLLEGRFDVAVRLGNPRDSTLVARRLLTTPEPIVAAPEVAARFDVARPRDLRGAPWVQHSLVSTTTMRFDGPRDQVDELTVDVHARANAGWAVRSLLLSGAGVGVLPRMMIAEDLAEGRLVQLCRGWSWKTVTLFALFPSARHRRPGVDAFVTELEARIAAARARWK